MTALTPRAPSSLPKALKALLVLPALALALLLLVSSLAVLATAQAGVLWIGVQVVRQPATFSELWLLCFGGLVVLSPVLGLLWSVRK